jgi:hypothetical protein
MELRWARAYVAESWRLAGMALHPTVNVVKSPQQIYDVPVDLGRKFQAVTMTNQFDTELQTNFSQRATFSAFVSPVAWLRETMVPPYRVFVVVLLLTLIPALAWRIWISDQRPFSPLSVVAMAVGLYLIARLGILSYVAVFMGAFDSRMMFSTYTLAMLFAPLIIYDLFGKKQDRESHV